VPVTFEQIKLGNEYDRRTLAALWGYQDWHAIGRGVVTPKGSNKIVLFITCEKQANQPQYADHLEGNELHWEGPEKHGGEDRIVGAKASGDEIHVFYRELHHSLFTYCGRAKVKSAQLGTGKTRSRFVYSTEWSAPPPRSSRATPPRPLKTSPAPKIFISYRRDDSPAYAGWLYEHLTARFGKANVFMDVDSVKLGVDFVENIQRILSQCDVQIALIGPRWLTATDAKGRRRLDRPEDFVRMEIVAALKRGIRLIPVLLDGVDMPSAGELPSQLAKLATRNGIEMSHKTFSRDASELIKALEQLSLAGD
jgi:hypothetical protein